MTDTAHPGTIAAEYLPDLSSLTADHRATFRIGQVVRLTVVMERTLRDIHARLQAVQSDKLRDGPESFGSLCSETARYIEASGFEGSGAAGVALEEIRIIYRERNRFAHDYLLPTDVDRWDRMSLENTIPPKHVKQIDEESLRDAVLDIVRAQWRLHALDILIAEWQRDAASTMPAPGDVHDGWDAILRGEFELTPGGGASVTSEI